MRRKSFKNSPGITKDLQKILNTRNMPMKYRRLAVADTKRQLDRIDAILFKKLDKPATKRRHPPKATP